MARKGGAPENLVPYVKGSERAKEANRKAIETQRINREKRKKMKEDLDILLKLSLKMGELAYAEDVLSLEEAEKLNCSVQTAIDIAMVQRAMMGDVQAATYIRDTVGEKPSDKVELDQNLTVEAWAKKHKVKL